MLQFEVYCEHVDLLADNKFNFLKKIVFFDRLKETREENVM